MSDQDPPVSRWVVRKSDGTELRFPSLDALKGYILSGVITQGDVVAPEDATWARVEDLAELASLMGMMAPPTDGAKAVKRPATRPNLSFGRALDGLGAPGVGEPAPSTGELLTQPFEDPTDRPKTVPPPLPLEETEAIVELEPLDEPATVYSGAPSFAHDPPSHDHRPAATAPDEHPTTQTWGTEPEPDPLSRPMDIPEALDDDPLSRPMQPSPPSDGELLSRPFTTITDDPDPLSRPLSHVGAGPQSHEIMTLRMRQAQRRRILITSIVVGALIATAAFFAVQSIQQASTPPEETAANPTPEETKPTPAENKPADPISNGPAAATPPAEKPKADETDTAAANPAPPTDEEAAKPAAPEEKPPPEVAEAQKPETQKPEAQKPEAKKPEAKKPKAKKPEAKKPAAKKAPKAKASSKKHVAAKGGDRKPSGSAASGSNDPTTIDGMMSRAKRTRKKNPAEALRLYKKVLAKKPNYPDAMQLGARSYLQMGRTSEAIKLLKQCRTKVPRFTPCIYYLGRAYERAGRKADANNAYKTLIDQFPESSLASKARQKLGP